MRVVAVTRAMERRSRPATYGTATRLARTVHALVGRPHGWRFQAIQEELDISEGKLLGTSPPAGASWCGRRAGRSSGSCAAATAASSALTVFQFLEGTVLKDGLRDLWEGFHRTLPPVQARLQHFDRKFFDMDRLCGPLARGRRTQIRPIYARD